MPLERVCPYMAVLIFHNVGTWKNSRGLALGGVRRTGNSKQCRRKSKANHDGVDSEDRK
jgi:hypothetical protein